MTMDHDDDRLAPYLAAARGGGAVSDALMARVLADAARVQATQPSLTPARPDTARGASLLAVVQAALGGWRGLTGVTLAGMTGLALGFLAPDVVDGLTGGQIGVWSGTSGALPEIDVLWEEGGDV